MVIAGTASGVGKTTVATGIMAALRHRGSRVGAAKVGPDFIDPGYHAAATGRPGRNLDPWLCGEAAMAALAARAGRGADVLVVEGVMGLYDGAGRGGAPTGVPFGSTAYVARLLDAPVVLVVDAASLSDSVAAIVHGFATWAPGVELAAVILNRVGSDDHEAWLRDALAPLGVPVVGALRRDQRLQWRDRHLGLVPVVEQPGAVAEALDRLAGAVAAGVDLAAVMAVAASAPRRPAPAPPHADVGGRCRLAVAGGRAFSFCYADNLELLVEAGAEIVPFDPLVDPGLPEQADALFVGGGFPEVYAAALADNRPLLTDARRRISAGLVTWAECGGLLWLSAGLGDQRLCGVVPTEGRMTDRLTLGYRQATFRTATPLGPEGTVVRGHEFHYSTVEPAGDALDLAGRTTTSAGGFASSTLLASYLHTHLAGAPFLATAFVRTATACAR